MRNTIRNSSLLKLNIIKGNYPQTPQPKEAVNKIAAITVTIKYNLLLP